MLQMAANLLADRHAEGYLGTPEGYLGSNVRSTTRSRVGVCAKTAGTDDMGHNHSPGIGVPDIAWAAREALRTGADDVER